MKLLVTGARGQVGSALCRLGAESPFDVVGLDSLALDITDPSAIRLVFERLQPDFIVNTAAYTAVDKAESEADKAERVNAWAVGYLAEAAAARNIPLVHLSTDYVFNGSKTEPYVETDFVAPLGVYGQTKLQGELLVKKHLERSIILRTSWVFGLEGNNFPKTMLRLARDRLEIGVVADQRGSPTFADDIARAILALGQRYFLSSTLPWGIYHYAGKDSCSWYEFAALIFKTAFDAGVIKNQPALRALITSEYPTAAKRPGNSILNCEKFADSFPEIPLSNWQEGIQILINNQSK